MTSRYLQNKTWRKKHPIIWRKNKQRYYKQFETGAYNKYQKYTIQEDNIITDKNYSDRIIAKKIKRSVKAIQIRRVRLKQKEKKL